MKKLLTLILTLILTTALLTVGANATWGDDAQNKYVKECEMITRGDTYEHIMRATANDGKDFAPDSKVSRAWACRAAAYIALGKEAADALPKVDCFEDVFATNSNAGYINWCKEQGIISGYGNGKFSPSTYVSRDAALKIMLGALGYKAAEQGYNKANGWRWEVLTDAQTAGLTEGLTIDNVVEIHRDEFCKLVVNALTVNAVSGQPLYKTSFPDLLG